MSYVKIIEGQPIEQGKVYVRREIISSSEPYNGPEDVIYFQSGNSRPDGCDRIAKDGGPVFLIDKSAYYDKDSPFYFILRHMPHNPDHITLTDLYNLVVKESEYVDFEIVPERSELIFPALKLNLNR